MIFNFSELKSIHVELTSRCQASCPMCARNYHGGIENPKLPKGEITLDDFKKIFNIEILNQLEYIYFCGNFGDPILAKDLLEIVDYCSKTNPKIRLGIHTNGSARTAEWWDELARVMPEDHSVHFALDGLEDTHHLYRIGTDFNKIIKNAQAFINAGGRADWVYLSFKHNEHQIEDAKQLAKELGFISFNHKSTNRFLEKPWFNVLDQNGKVSYKIEPPKEHKVSFISPDVIKSYKELTKTATIDCKIKREKSLYIDSFKNLWPCCWIGSIPYIYSKPEDLVFSYQEDQTAVLNEILEYFGGYDSIDLDKVSIKKVLENERWQTVWQKYWDEKRLATCAKICGNFPTKVLAKHEEQYIKKDHFNG